MTKVILITGCSTGIGRDLAQRLSKSGYTVIATARNVVSMDDLDVAQKLPLDVTQPEAILNTVGCVIQHYGKIDVLVNNAGYAQVGVIEELEDAQIQRMYDVNLFGVIRMIHAVAPHMREQKAGQIINISSIAGKVATPANGAYSSSKFALEAVSDALRLELKPFNIQVILVEPGAIKTNFDQTVHTYGDEILSNPLSPYLNLYRKHSRVAEGMRVKEPGPEVVSKVIQQVVETSKPKARYLAGISFSGRLVLYFRDYLWDLVVRQMFKIIPQV